MSILLPAEWQPQSGVQLTWPHANSDWAWILPDVEPVFVEIAKAVTRFEQLLVVANDPAHQQHIQTLLQLHGVQPGRCHVYVQPSNDTWARDHGPVTVLDNGKPRLLDFVFNGWGNKFDASLDTQITAGLYAQEAFNNDVELSRLDFVLEGGSIESDGQGSLLTTSHCLLTPTRNPQYSRDEVESYLKKLLGIDRILWLNQGELAGDDTDSHVDMLARLCTPDTIAYSSCDDKADQHYAPLKAMLEELQAFRTREDQPYRLVALPIPAAIHDEDGQRLPASYANFLIMNGAVLLPVYADPMDEIAIQRLGEIFPDREIIPIDCRHIIRQYGSLHCLTMQLPEGVLN